jgi:shikimate kinase
MPKSKDIIVLVGPMGVGKSTVGRKLAKMLGLKFIDTDSVFVEEHGRISDFFEQHGEPRFRELEEEALAKSLVSPAVVATGGGVILSQKNRAALESVTVVYLSTDGKHIASRLKSGARPLLKNGVEDWRRIYDSRKHLYEQVADLEINTSGHPLNTTIAEIREKLEI